jgi:hypothetical protein
VISIGKETIAGCLATETIEDEGFEFENVFDGKTSGTQETATLLGYTGEALGSSKEAISALETVAKGLKTLFIAVVDIDVVVREDVIDGDGGEEGGGEGSNRIIFHVQLLNRHAPVDFKAVIAD